MKKLISALAALGLVFCLAVTALAAPGSTSGQHDLTALPGSTGIDVTADCLIDINYYEIILGSNADTVTLPDNVTLRGFSTLEENNGLRVIIIPVTAADWPEAYTWSSGKLSSLGKAPFIYYLMFYKGNEKVASVEEVSITMTLPGGYESALLYHMADGSDKADKLSYAKTDSGPSFVMSTNGFYAFLKANSGGYYYPTTPAVKPSATTGDGSHLGLWGALALLSAAGAAVILSRRRHKHA